jgi:glycopeptide antibiotics resistance protein
MFKPVASVPQVGRWGHGIVIACLLFIAWATLRPEPGQMTTSHFCVICGDFGTEDAVLNIALFLPLGLGLALCGLRVATVILIGFALSTCIELTQLFFIPGRDATIGDVVMNTGGTALGALLVLSWPTWRFPSHRIARMLLVAGSMAWLAVQSLASFAFTISLPESRYYGQLARKLGQLELFEGRIDSVRVGTLPIGNTLLPATSQIRSALNRGEELVAVVRPTAPTVGIAPIVRIADENEQQILLLAQQGDAALFAVRTGASALRVRPPTFELPHAFPVNDQSPAGAGDAIAVSGRYTGRAARLATTGYVTATADFSARAAMAWMTLLPLTWSVRGSAAEILLSMMWTAALLIPIGYWAALYLRTSATPSAWQTTRVVASLAMLLIIGLVLIPFATSTGSASPLDFTAAILGLLAGSFIAYLLRLPRPISSHEAKASP